MTITMVREGRSPVAQQQRNGGSRTLRLREGKRPFCFNAGRRPAGGNVARLPCEIEFMPS